jgi:hypothetical protein
MEKICSNCKYWEVFPRIILRGNCSYRNMVTADEMSCGSHKDLPPEIPAELRDWKPVWHPASEPPEIRDASSKLVLTPRGKAIGLNLRNNVWVFGAYSGCAHGDALEGVEFWSDLP